MKRRTLLAAGMGGLAAAAIGQPALAGGPDAKDRMIALVPLDDRPVNTYCPQMTAASAGVRLELPPRDLLGRFFTPGDGAAIANWLGTVTNVDGYVISVSMLAYGGLIASRTATPTLAQALSNVEAIRALRVAHPEAAIEVHDTIQRLALTSTGTPLDAYISLLVSWAKLYDQVVNLGQEELRPELDATRAKIPDEIVEDYLAARARNHRINTLMVEWVADGTISHLVLSEDDTAPVGLARAERVELEALAARLGVTDRVEIFPGADEVDALLVARVIASGTAPTYRIEYAGVSGEGWTAALEGIPFAENIRRHVASVGGRVVDGDADIVLAVNTPSATSTGRGADLDAFVARIGTLIEGGSPVIVVDPLIVNKADHELVARKKPNSTWPSCCRTPAGTPAATRSGWRSVTARPGGPTCGRRRAGWAYRSSAIRGARTGSICSTGSSRTTRGRTSCRPRRTRTPEPRAGTRSA